MKRRRREGAFDAVCGVRERAREREREICSNPRVKQLVRAHSALQPLVASFSTPAPYCHNHTKWRSFDRVRVPVAACGCICITSSSLLSLQDLEGP